MAPPVANARLTTLGAAAPEHPIGRFLARLPADLAASFTREQLAAVELHFAMRYRHSHALDWRRRIKLPFLRVYVVLLAGRDRKEW
jgi:hypothetical protein